MLRSSAVIETDAPGTGAPDASRTVPVMVPVVSCCAGKRAVVRKTADRKSAALEIKLMFSPHPDLLRTSYPIVSKIRSDPRRIFAFPSCAFCPWAAFHTAETRALTAPGGRGSAYLDESPRPEMEPRLSGVSMGQWPTREP